MTSSSLEPNTISNLRLGDGRRVRVFEPNFYRRALTTRLKSIRSIYAPLTCLYLEFVPGLVLILTIIGYILISSGEIKLPWDEQLSTAEKTARSNAGIVSSFILLGLVGCALHALFLNINACQIRTARAAQMTSTTELLLQIRHRLWIAPFGAKNLKILAAQELNERPALERSIDETYLNGLSTVAMFRNVATLFSFIFCGCVIVSNGWLYRSGQSEAYLANGSGGAAILFLVLHILCMCIALPRLCSQKYKQSFVLAKINARSEILTTCFAPFNGMFVGVNLY